MFGLLIGQEHLQSLGRLGVGSVVCFDFLVLSAHVPG
jgi:hypothetical protein